jgi:Pretoxin HINT domain
MCGQSTGIQNPAVVAPPFNPPKPKPQATRDADPAACAKFGTGCQQVPVPAGDDGTGGTPGWLRTAVSTVGNATGITAAVGCIEHPTLGGCTKAALQIGMDVVTVTTLGGGAVAEVSVDGALDVGGDVVADGTAEAGGDSVAAAGEGSGDDAATSCSTNSFTGNTRVLLADGETVPIDQVAVGDKVLATDPAAGVSQARPVTGLIVHSGPHTMTAVTLAGGATITATDHHPFWDATTGQFTDADALRAGDKLREASGRLVQVAKTRTYVAVVTAYNLTISAIHTYYVVAGTTSVLVHNSCGPEGSSNEPVPTAGPEAPGWSPTGIIKTDAGAPNPFGPSVFRTAKAKWTYFTLRLITSLVPQGGVEHTATSTNPISIVWEYVQVPASDGLGGIGEIP